MSAEVREDPVPVEDPAVVRAREYQRAVDEAAGLYINSYEQLRHARAQLELLERHIKEQEQANRRAREVLEQSVQPVCGSATKPYMRCFAMVNARVLVVAYERNSVKGLIRVEDLR